ncbi:MAG: single-stranded-DNA-specific exonuclease RecJ [Selenomonadaceae bacterium]|nr:single-stranded-DNA-specific exonuclease RecJ [Selenomonadaceae bacterium]
MLQKKWKILEPVDGLARLAEELGTSAFLASLLCHRGIRTREQADLFLHPEKLAWHDPFLLADMDAAVARIRQAIERGEHIVIYGDYDVDGITSTTLMLRNLRALGADVSYYLPERSEGYGFNEKALQRLAASYDLLLSVDCGITSCDLVEAYKDQMDFVLTDHHLPGAALPPALAVVNPHREDDRYPCKDLCGCGVAFKLCQALWQNLEGIEGASSDLELVALATVADVVPLQDENRKIVKLGLAQMMETELPGIRALIKVSGLSDKALTSESIGFGLAPRLNAAGRMASPKLGVELLMAKSMEEAEPLAEQLNALNAERKSIESQILDEAEERLAAQTAPGERVEDLPALVVAGKGWNPGVIGIVGSRLVEKYYRPAIVCSIQENGVAKGSCRSIEGLSMYEALSACQGKLVQFGGHAQAAGLSVEASKIPAFREAFCSYARQHLSDEDYIPIISVEAEWPPERLTEEQVEDIARLEPYGMGNPRPVFGVRNARGWGARAIGRDNTHLRFNVGAKDRPVAALYWRHGDLAGAVEREALDLLYEPQIHEWNGQKSIQIVLEDMAPARAERVHPTREILANVYRILASVCSEKKEILLSSMELTERYNQRYNQLSLFTMQESLRIFEELGFLEMEPGAGRRMVPPAQKMDLMASPTYRAAHQAEE